MKVPFCVYPTTACLLTAICFWPAVAYFRGGALPDVAPVAAAASPAHAPMPTFTTISFPTVKFTAPSMEETPWEERFPSAAVAKIEPPQEATPAPVRASVVHPSRHCDKYVHPIAIPRRESLLDDMEDKLKAALVSSNRNSLAYSRCKRKEQASSGG